MRANQIIAMVLAAAALGASGLAFAQAVRTPAETVDYRHQQFRRVGQTFKAINDGLRAGSPDVAALHTQAQTLATLSQNLPSWFPAGTAAPVGDRNRAKAEIWSNAAAFQTQATNFQTAAQNLAAANDLAAIRAAAPQVGRACATCHQGFRAQD